MTMKILGCYWERGAFVEDALQTTVSYCNGYLSFKEIVECVFLNLGSKLTISKPICSLFVSWPMVIELYIDRVYLVGNWSLGP